MSRLTQDWIDSIAQRIKLYEGELINITGFDLVALAARAAGVRESEVREATETSTVAVIPITSGHGVVNTFVETVAAVAKAMGFKAMITEHSDVSGFWEARQRGAEIILMADDETFMAINAVNSKLVNNTEATAWGFVTALISATGNVAGKKVLVIGHGAVGKEALKILREKEAVCSVYDIDPQATEGLDEQGVHVLKSASEIKDYGIIFDASCQGEWLSLDMLAPDVFIVTPGVPLSLHKEAHDFLRSQKRIIHDYLQIGVATMLAEIV